MLSKRLLLPVTLFAVFVTPAVAHAADPSGNIRLTVPSQIQYRVKTSGELAAPSASLLKMENNSDFEVRVASVKMNAAPSWNLVDNASLSDLPNSVSIVLGPANDPLNMSYCAGAAKNVDNKNAWTMTTKAINSESASIQLATEGYTANVRDVGTVGSVEWYIVSDTVTNQVFGRLDTVEERLDVLEEKTACPMPIGSILQMADGTDPNLMYPGTTWVKIEGKFLLSSSSSYTRGATGGEASTTLAVGNLPSHTHTYDKSAANTGGTAITVAQLPSHDHSYAKVNANTNNHTLTVAQIPGHTHGLTSITGIDDLNFVNGNGSFLLQNSDTTIGWSSAQNASLKTGATGSTGGGGAHSHGIGTTSTTTGKTGSGNTHSHTISTSSTNSGSAGSGTAFSNMPPYEVVDMWKRTA